MTSAIAADDETGVSAAHTAKVRLQRELLKRLRVHEREGTLATNARFLLYELMPEPLAAVLERQERQCDQVAERLRELMDGEGST